MNDTSPYEAPKFSINEMFANLILPAWLRETAQAQLESGLAMNTLIAMGNLLRYSDVAPTQSYEPFGVAMLKIKKYQEALNPEVLAQAVAQAINTIDSITTWLMSMDTMTLMLHPEAVLKVNRFIEHRDNLQSLEFLYQYTDDAKAKRQMFLYSKALERLDSAALSHRDMWLNTPVELTARYLTAQKMNEPHWWLAIHE